jgi:hypothetical protein
VTDLEGLFEDLENCCLHQPQWRPGDVHKVLRWHGERSAAGDSFSVIIVRLKGNIEEPGGYGLLTQSSDYTGHGCQCDSMTVREPGLAALLAHLTYHELEELISRD